MKNQLLLICLMSVSGTALANEQLKQFVPQGFDLKESHCTADFNQDGKKDCVLLIKDTQKLAWQINSHGQLVDKNRRGIVILFKNKTGYQKVLENKTLFASENEEGGVYFAPELSIVAKNQTLKFDYGHGRYGSWSHTFDYRKSDNKQDFYWIGYDRYNNYGPYTKSIDSVNFLTHRYLHKYNTAEDLENDRAIFKETPYRLPRQPLIKLSQIHDIEDIEIKLDEQLYNIKNPQEQQ